MPESEASSGLLFSGSDDSLSFLPVLDVLDPAELAWERALVARAGSGGNGVFSFLPFAGRGNAAYAAAMSVMSESIEVRSIFREFVVLLDASVCERPCGLVIMLKPRTGDSRSSCRGRSDLSGVGRDFADSKPDADRPRTCVLFPFVVAVSPLAVEYVPSGFSDAS